MFCVYKSLTASNDGFSKSVRTLFPIISLNLLTEPRAPLTKLTEGLVDHNFIKKLKKNCIFVNTARGEIVKNLDNLHNALLKNKIYFVALDVLPDESVPIKNSKLLNEWKSNSKLSNRILINPQKIL